MRVRPLLRDRQDRVHLARHYLEMVAAMGIGMVVLGALESLVLGPFGWSQARQVPELTPIFAQRISPQVAGSRQVRQAYS